MRLHRWWIPLLLAAPVPAAAALRDQDPGQDLSSLSIEELAQVSVRSASKREEPLNRVPAAAYVITNDDILRSAATSLPEVLRQAPNLQVQRVNSSQYAISSRGFGGIEPGNKILALIDGRSIYSTLHSGVFWELHSPLLEDIAQIEVIGGPGGTLYGPNAVNGVISIASKDSAETQGLLARATAGANERTAGARYGMRLGDSAALRIYGNWYDRPDMPQGIGAISQDAIRGWQIGFRADAAGDSGLFTFQGDLFDNETFRVAGEGNRGQNLLARWTRGLSDNSSIQLKAYYDYFQRRELLTVDTLETFDAEAQYNLDAGAHSLVAGVGVRTTRDRFVNNLNTFQLVPASQRLWIGNGFVQDRFALSEQLSITAGIKLEGSSYTGLQVLPNLRLAWQASEKALFWASVGRALRTPSRIDRDLTAAGLLAGAPDFASEKLTAFEIGFRGQPSVATTLSISGYYNLYKDIRTAKFIGAPFPLQLANDTRGHVLGVEAQAVQQMLPWWRVTAGAMWLRKDFEVLPGRIDLTNGAALGQEPAYQFSLRSRMDLPGRLTLDAGYRAVGGFDTPPLDGYGEADLRIGWHASDRIELYVAGENLLHRRHYESNDIARLQLIQRSIYAGARLRF